jgi:hypothetical protein
MTKQIFLSKGKIAIVDDEDYEWLSQWRWYCIEGRYTAYAARTDNKNKKTVYMHKEILGVQNGVIVDHKNRDGLLDTKDNLRICSYSQNAINRKKNKNNTSGYRGVFFDKKNGAYRAKIVVDGKIYRMGNFSSAVEAAVEYDKVAKEVSGEFANLNFLV